MTGRIVALSVALGALVLLCAAALLAPEHVSTVALDLAYASPQELPPFGADHRGRPLSLYLLQASRIVAVPALVAGTMVMASAVCGGVLAASGWPLTERLVQGLGEVVGALPRMVVVLVVALVLPRDQRTLLPLAVTWALLCAPGAMDEAVLVARRLGGARFVEALRAHGYGPWRIYVLHVAWGNLRPVVVRQGAETMMQVVFLEIALSYLASSQDLPSLTHRDDVKSIADLLHVGYPALVLDVPSLHALVLGLGFIWIAAVATASLTFAARER